MKLEHIEEGDKVHAKEGDFTGNVVKIYHDEKLDDWVYVICSVKVDAPELGVPGSLEEIAEWAKDIPSKIVTSMKCVSYKFDSEDEVAKL